MPATDVALKHYRVQTVLETATQLAARRLWARMDEHDFDSSWLTIGWQLRALITAAQLTAAQAGAAVVGDVLTEIGVNTEPAAVVLPSRLAGVSSFGAQLTGTLRRCVIVAKVAVSHGQDATEALAVGGRLLAGIAVTQVADANRAATRVGIVCTPGVGYARFLEPDSCRRCAALAARTFSWRQGFARHPYCGCRPVPAPPATAARMTTDDPDPVPTTGKRAGLAVPGVAVTASGLQVMPEALITGSSRREVAVMALVAHGYARRA